MSLHSCLLASSVTFAQSETSLFWTANATATASRHLLLRLASLIFWQKAGSLLSTAWARSAAAGSAFSSSILQAARTKREHIPNITSSSSLTQTPLYDSWIFQQMLYYLNVAVAHRGGRGTPQ